MCVRAVLCSCAGAVWVGRGAAESLKTFLEMQEINFVRNMLRILLLAGRQSELGTETRLKLELGRVRVYIYMQFFNVHPTKLTITQATNKFEEFSAYLCRILEKLQ